MIGSEFQWFQLRDLKIRKGISYFPISLMGKQDMSGDRHAGLITLKDKNGNRRHWELSSVRLKCEEQ